MNKADDYYRQAEEMYKNHADYINSIYFEDSGGELVCNLNDIFELYWKSYKSLKNQLSEKEYTIQKIKDKLSTIINDWGCHRNNLVQDIISELETLLKEGEK